MMQEHLPSRVKVLAVVLVCVICAFCCSLAQEQAGAKPFSKDDVMQLLKGSVPVKRVEDLSLKRGIDFQITPQIETELRQAGANDELLTVLRVLSPKEGASVGLALSAPILLIHSTPGGVHVYVDDETRGTTSPAGELRITALASGQHRVRVSLQDHDDSERVVQLIAGQTFDIDFTLSPKSAPGATAEKTVAATAKPIVYFLRRRALGGSAISPQIYCDGVEVGKSHNGRYFTIEVSPGKHILTSTKNGSQIELNAVGGESYYIDVTMVSGLPARGKLTSMPKDQGAYVAQSLRPDNQASAEH